MSDKNGRSGAVRSMNFLPLRLLALGLAFCIAGLAPVAAGEISVLLSFDNSGHQVVLVRSVGSPDAPASATPESSIGNEILDMSTLIKELESGTATLVWKDENGHLQSRTYEPDPRVTRSPGHIDGEAGTRVGERKGAWLVSGPDTATSLTILLPGDVAVGLGFEQWEIALVPKVD